ncbi:Peptidase family M50 [compost metagenome]
MLAQFGVLDSITNEKLFQAVLIFFNLFTVMNFFLFLFNLIPLPPLDGYRILEDVVPRRMLGKLQQYEQWSVLIFLVILIVPGMQRYTISPLYNAAEAIYFQFAHLFLAMFGA